MRQQQTRRSLSSSRDHKVPSSFYCSVFVLQEEVEEEVRNDFFFSAQVLQFAREDQIVRAAYKNRHESITIAALIFICFSSTGRQFSQRGRKILF